jgi:hypothetical protein
MPISPLELFERVGYRHTGSVPWHTSPKSSQPGVYAVSLSADPASAAGLNDAPINTNKVAAWIERVPTFQFDNFPSPAPEDVVARLSTFWLPDEAIVYIGKATTLSDRVSGYYKTPLGNRSPHAGGHWIKTLDVLNNLTVHYAEVKDGSDPEAIEYEMMRFFQDSVSLETRSRHPQPSLLLPFANLEGPGGRRSHGIRGAKLGKKSTR